MNDDNQTDNGQASDVAPSSDAARARRKSSAEIEQKAREERIKKSLRSNLQRRKVKARALKQQPDD